MKKIVLIVVLVVIGVALLTLSFKMLSNEDDWICVGGKWVKHGNPSAEMPEGLCE